MILSGNKILKTKGLDTDFLLELSLRSFQPARTLKTNFKRFASYLLKNSEIHAFILDLNDSESPENFQSPLCQPSLSSSSLSEIAEFTVNHPSAELKSISKRSKLYKKLVKSLKVKLLDVHYMNVASGISVYLACSPSLSTEKHFKNLSAIINAFAKQADVKIKQQKATQTQKQLQEENTQLKKSLQEHAREKNETVEFPKRIVDLNSFPIVNVQKGKILSYNKALKTLIECNDKYLRTTNYIDIIHPDDRPTIVNLAMKFILGQEKTVTVQVKVLTPKGKVKDILMSMHSIPDDNGVHQYTNCTIHDITEQKKLGDQLIKSQSQYEQLVEASPAGIIQTDEKGVIQFSSARANEIFAFKKNQLNGKKLDTLISKSNKKQFNSALMGMSSENTKFVGEFECKSKKKDKLFIQCSLGVLSDNNGKISGYLVVFNDASKEIEASRKIVESQATLNSIINSTNEALIAYDENYVVLMVNKLAKRYIRTLLDFTVNIGVQIPKRLRKQFMPKSDFYKSSTELPKTLRRIESPKGDRVIEISYARIKDRDSNILGILETGKDITELIRKEQLLTESESQYRFLVDNMNAGVSLIKPTGVHAFINQKGLDIFGIKKSSNKLKVHFKDLFHKDEYERFVNVRKTLKPNQQIPPEVYRALNDKGETVYIELSISLIANPDDKDAPYLFSYTDVTSAIKAQKELTNREATLNAVLNSTPDGIYAIDKNLNIISVNRQAVLDFENQIGGSIEVNRNLKEFIDKDVLDKWKETYFDRVFKGESFKYIGPSNGEEFFIENSYAPVVTEDGEIIGCLEVSKDISELRKQELALIASEEQYRLLIETSPAGIIQVSLDGEVEFISKKGADMLGYSVKEALGIDGFKLIAPKDQEFLKNTLGELFDGKEETISTINALKKDGKEIIVESSSKLIKNKEGIVEGVLLVYYDITEKEQTRRALESTQSYFSIMYENSFDPIFVYNLEEEKIIECNKAALQLFEFDTKKEIKAISRFDLIPNKSKTFPNIEQHDILKTHYDLVRENKTINVRGVALTKTGKELIVSVNIIPTQDKGSEAFVLFHDDTDRFKSFQALEKSKKEIEYERALYEAIIKNSFDGVDITEFTVENDVYSNPRMVLRNNIMKKFLKNDKNTYSTLEEMIEIQPRLLTSTQTSTEVTSEEIQELLRKISKGFFSKERQMIEFNIKTQDNKQLTVESSHKIIEFNENAYMIRNYRDISDRIKQEEIIKLQIENLNEKNKELQGYIESNMQLENFAYIASHDLKAPLRSVSSFAHLLKSNCYADLDDKGKRFLDIIEESAMNMQWLIDDLLDYSRINTENIKKVDLNIKHLLSRIQTGLEEEIRKSKTKIVIEETPETIFADESMMIQLFQNLIHNAIKFVQKDEKPLITIKATLEADNYHFIVKDNGIGIAEENVKKIFGIFNKLHSNDVYKGTGLGLTICKTIIERHKGTIWVESEIGKGSEFHFTIPASKRK